MKFLKRFYLLIPISFLFVFTACEEDSESARLVIKLVDKAATYEKVYVDIQGVSVHTNGDAEETDAGWVDVAGSIGKKNLLEYTGGTELTLVDTDFPAGRISQIRLKLGSDNSVVLDEGDQSVVTEEKEIDLKTPSGQQSGLKLQVHENLTAGITYEFKLDFDASRSIIHNGADDYILKPVIRVITEAKGGAIQGTVSPPDLNVLVRVLNDDDEIIASTSTKEGKYILSGIDAGTYSIEFVPPTPADGSEDTVYETVVIENVVVKTGEVTTADPNPVVLNEVK